MGMKGNKSIFDLTGDLEKSLKTVNKYTWMAIENSNSDVKLEVIEAIGTLYGLAKVGAYSLETLREANEQEKK
jgi:hypothetical protein